MKLLDKMTLMKMSQNHSRYNWFGPLFFLGVLVVLVVGLWNGRPARPSTDKNGVIVVETAVSYPLDLSQPTYEPPPTAVPIKIAPDFALIDLFDETIVHTRSEYNGRPLILNFWASWCVPCREEMPALQRAYDEFSPNGLAILGINETYIDNLEAAQAFVTDLGLTFPSVRDEDGKTSDELYRIIGLPTSIFITPEGKVAHVQIGQMTEEQIQFYSSQLIAGKPITP
ncbi:MAG: hypothetical protein Kow0080_00160 [Candidatus Promineifilaceae bacterium]